MVSVNLIKFFDKYVGFIICVFLSLFNRLHERNKDSVKSILLIQFWGIGETILTLPAIKRLREEYPKAKIDILVTSRVESVFFKNKSLDSIRVVNLDPFSLLGFMLYNKNKYDLAIDMEEYLKISAIISFFVGKERIGYDHGIRSWLYNHKVKYNDKQHVSQTFMDLLKPLGIKEKVNSLLKVNYSKQDEVNVKGLLKRLKVKKPLIALSPGAAESSKIRMWPNRKWAELIDKINTPKFKGTILLIGAADVTDTNQDILNKVKQKKNVFDISGKTNVKGLFALSEKVDLMVSIDSGPMHVAAAQGTPTIGLFGPNTPIRFGPLNKKSVSIYKPVAKPVINVHKGQVPNHSDVDHMKKISVNDVFSEIKRIKVL